MYSNYLQKNQKQDPFKCAPVTELVAKQTEWLMQKVGYDVYVVQHPEELSIPIAFKGKYVGKVVEGCNSVSLLILFVAFVVAFSGSFLSTAFFLILGSFIIWIINIVRIAVLVVALYKYPEQEAFLHKLLFPAIIYGTIFLLWVVWVNKFSGYKK